MLGKKNSYWEEKDCIQTVKALCAQPEAWKKTQKTVREQKDAIKAFVEPVLVSPGKTVVFTGLDGILAETLFAWVNTDVQYNCRFLQEGEVLKPEEHDLLICIEYEGNTMELAAAIDRQPEPVKVLIVTADENSPLIRAARDMENMYGMAIESGGFASLLLAAFMTLHLEILDDLQLDDVIHSAGQILNSQAAVLEDFVKEHSFPAIRAVGFNVRQKRHALKEMVSVMKASFVSPYTGLPYEGEPLNLLYLPNAEGQKKEQLELLKVLRRDDQLTFAVESRHTDTFHTDGSLDLKLLIAHNNVYAAFDFLLVFEAMIVIKAAFHNIALDEGREDILLSLDSWMEKQKFDDTIQA